MPNDIAATFAARGTCYGDFLDQARLTQGIKRIYESGRNWQDMTDLAAASQCRRAETLR